jgi:hypothetical protein
MTIIYLCRECGNPAEWDDEGEDSVMYCPDHPKEIIDSVVYPDKRPLLVKKPKKHTGLIR